MIICMLIVPMGSFHMIKCALIVRTGGFHVIICMLIVHIGGFHVIICILRRIYFRFKDSDIVEILVEAVVGTEGTIRAAM